MPHIVHAGRQLCRTVWKKTSRKGARMLMFFSTEERKMEVERWLRGMEDVRKLNLTDIVIVAGFCHRKIGNTRLGHREGMPGVMKMPGVYRKFSCL